MTDINRNTVDIVNGFIPNALRTLSPAWHGDMCAKHNFVSAINDAIKAINRLDQIKKTLFYGRDNNLIANGQADVMGLPDSIPCDGSAANLIHGILGKVTESGELLEALREAYNGNKPLDRVNVIEEVGDGFWYDAIILDEEDSSFPDAMGRVIAKLRARFPDKFTAENANVRDLANERTILEAGLVLDDNGDDSTPALIPAERASGAAAVTRAEAAADQAFSNVGNVKSGYIDPGSVRTAPDLSRGIGARSTPLPGEHIARQLVRRDDT